jgi:hypothetical protein
MPHMTTRHVGLAYFVVSVLYASILTSLLRYTRTRMLHREATIAAHLAKTGRVPVVHDDPEAQKLQANQKKATAEYKANKVAGTVRAQGVYDAPKQQTAKQRGDDNKKELADRGGNEPTIGRARLAKEEGTTVHEESTAYSGRCWGRARGPRAAE